MFKKILVPTDGLFHSRKAAEYATKLAKLTNAEIVGIHVVPTSLTARTFARDLSQLRSEYYENGKAFLKQIEGICIRELVPVRTVLTEGLVSQEILRTAETENVDIIVIGSRRKSSIERFVTGRVSDEIIRNSRCPVIVLNTPW